ncbi:diaminopimelate decarboxylase [Telmatospirillum siberiense]|uniref:Diaminopimelate decarboxylase n=1 Tax=Telmatospirillum siberiense TaxID=382514 RepID=A0A2N3PNN6_9PROT|nr:diaminopimelate decarboxylase [Telmatospirillum siberiense]PKU22018.1 diaminopimelate decarboxylase [Telmatospirillum siberiense]
MNHFHYRNGVLHAEDVSLARLAEEVGTPFYCYSTATLERHFRVLQEAVADLNATICFAIKANSNIAVIRTLAALGAGADVVSEGELRRALTAGVPPERIVFSGVGKTRRELELAVDSGILQINVESEPELEELNDVALSRGRRAVIGLRVNPDVDANTHAKITTGRKENKFGIEWTRAPEVLRRARGLPGIELASIAAHIGSQLTDLQPFRDAFRRLRDLVLMLKAEGAAPARLDLGGGLGVPYDDQPTPSPVDYAAAIRDNLGDLGCRLILEPGRMLVGNAGILVSRVIYVKEGATRSFVICDAAMNDLIRPAMYDAFHKILPVTEATPDAVLRPVDVVGPICESGDTFAKQRALPPLAKDDLIAFATAGAYGSAMSSTYNSRPLAPEVLVKADRFAVVRARPTYEEMLALESSPPWL